MTNILYQNLWDKEKSMFKGKSMDINYKLEKSEAAKLYSLEHLRSSFWASLQIGSKKLLNMWKKNPDKINE